MLKNIVFGIAASLIFVVTLAVVKYFQISAAIAQSQHQGPPPQAVTSYIAKQEVWPFTYKTIGTVSAVSGVMLSAEEGGRVVSINFESGTNVNKDDVLVELDSSVEQSQRDAVKAQLDLAEITEKRQKTLRDKNAVSQSSYDLALSNLANLKAEYDRLSAVIDKKKIIAPFSGKAGIRQVDLGEMLSFASPVVELQQQDNLNIDFYLPQNAVKDLIVGDGVNISLDQGVNIEAKLTAISSKVDPVSRNISLQATLENKDNILVPGMYVDVEVVLAKTETIVSVPISSVNYTPFGNSVYVIKPGESAEPRDVQSEVVVLGRKRGDQVAVLQGLSSGSEIISSGAFKIFPGAKVIVNNIVQPENELAPQPKDS